MAENKNPPPPVKVPFIPDNNFRDDIIKIAFRELVVKQIEDWKINHEMAAVLAVRYANEVMKAKQNTDVLNVVVAKGTTTAPVPPAPEPAPANEPPKSIAEIIGEAPALAEVK